MSRKLKICDLEVYALSLTAEFMAVHGENLLFKEINKEQRTNLIERSEINKRIRKLFFFLKEVRTKLASQFLEFEYHTRVYRMLLGICKFASYKRIKICKNKFKTAP